MAGDADDRPRERPGARRDYEPHRGTLMGWLAIGCLFGALPGFFFACLVFTAAPSGEPEFRRLLAAVLAGCAVWCLALGGPTWAVARADLKKMRANVMDPAGREPTRRAEACASLCLAVGPPGLAVSGWALLHPLQP